MERRRSDRKKVSIEAKIVAEDASYQGVIENISLHGICLETDSGDILSDSKSFSPGSEFQVEFQTPLGEVLKLHCKVKWSFKNAPIGIKRSVGMEIIFPPPGYMELYKELKKE